MLINEYMHTLDAKSRIMFPARMREEFGERFYLTRWLDDCIAVFNSSEWERLCEKIKNLPAARSRDLQRFFFASAVEVEPDPQGRIVIPQTLREHSGITREVAIIGVYNRAEIWDKQKWLERSKSVNASLAESTMLELDI